MTARQDFTIIEARYYAISVTLTEADLETRLNLSDSLIQWAVTSEAGTLQRIVKTSADSTQIHITAPLTGELIIYLTQEDTADLGGMVCDHEMVLTDSFGSEFTVMRGLLTITKSLVVH